MDHLTRPPPTTSTSASFQFTIKNLATLAKPLYSPVFSSGSDQQLWQLGIRPAQDDKEYISVYLYLLPNNRELRNLESWKIRCKATLQLIDEEWRREIVTVVLREFSIRAPCKGCSHFIKRSEVPVNKVHFKINFANVDFSETAVRWSDNHCPIPQSLVDSWSGVLKNSRLADVVFYVNGHAILAMKDVICGRSIYFRNMFESGCVESRRIPMAETKTWKDVDEENETAEDMVLENDRMSLGTKQSNETGFGNSHGITTAAKSPLFKRNSQILDANRSDNTFLSEEELEEAYPSNYYHVVNVTDCDPKTFSHFLHYLYTNEITLRDGTEASDINSLFLLFQVADKYQVNDLRGRILLRIYKNLSVANVAEVLFASTQWADLKQLCMDFAINHFTEVRETDGFSKVTENPLAYSGFAEIAKVLFKSIKLA
ncbi:6507_t:CDS:2 [Paraglomus brasilianum]|uniref:6507_t:CDS:1 n=1 Tax=Paraglomus brasilianum TaxID=144538 RepID=A0A9N8WCZ7_9GLOM|nr:6507_t:CDS:2 [Paraglomus brasilianum]